MLSRLIHQVFSIRVLRVSALVSFALTMVAVCVLAGAAQAQPKQIRIVESIWGFDGRVVPGQFNPLSILIDNLSDDPVEGFVTLQSVSGMVRNTGAQFTETIYLSPHTTRWVQFYPYVNRYATGWRVSVRTEQGLLFSDSMDQGRSVFESVSGEGDSKTVQAVILDKSGLTSRQPTTVKHMPDEVFPPFSTATAPLGVLFLDHVPDWESPRQEALISWLRCGGKLHLLLDTNGEPLHFPATMAELNEPFNEFNVGSGTVTRYEIQRSQLTSQIVDPLVVQAGQKDDPDAIESATQTELQMRNSVADPGTTDNELFSLMRELTQPEHAWWLIFLLSLAYVGMVFPGCWFLSQKKSLHYLTTYGAIAGLSILFSFIFLFIGRRGYGESTVMHSLAVARFEDESHLSCFQWGTLFVTEANDYSVTSNDQQALWASGSVDEEVDGKIRSGNRGQFDVRIPPFSSQTMLSRRRLTIPDWELELGEFNGDGNELLNLSIHTGAAFPFDNKWRIILLYGRNLYEGRFDAATRTITRTTSLQRLVDFCNFRPTTNFGGFWGMGDSGDSVSEQ